MAEMGLGYGSEFQLMRDLGHHREYLNKLIHDATNTNGVIEWLDFPPDNERISGDGEWKGIACFKDRLGKDKYNEIEATWKGFWPQRGTAMNWDSIFRIGDVWYFVEAKAHEGESCQECSATSEVIKETIRKAFESTQKWLNVKTEKDWIETNCYQLANRLAFLYFCNKKCNIQAKLVYIGFINGFRLKVGEKFIGVKDEVHSEDEWKKVWDRELQTLGLNKEKVAPYIFFIHPDCLSPKK